MSVNESPKEFDLIIIGSGPGGYIGAIRAAQLGMRVACVEKMKTLGGTCLNIGCIPSKALLESSEHFQTAKDHFKEHGILIEGIKVNLDQMMTRKNELVKQLTQGIAGLFKKNKIESFFGEGSFEKKDGSNHVIKVKNGKTAEVIKAPKVIIATGSVPTPLRGVEFDGKRIISSTEALEISEIPKHFVVVGGGVIGLELGSVWARLGSKVTVVEFSESITPTVDKQITRELQKVLEKLGMNIKVNTECTGAKVSGKNVSVEIKDRKSGDLSSLDADYVLVATGRKPFTGGLALENISLKPNERGMIDINDHFETSIAGVYAIGDVVRGPMLAHKAEEEGVAVAELIAGQAGHVNYNAIPSVIYTWPEVASVGKTEEELKAEGIPYKKGTFPFLANGRAKAMLTTEGLVKVLAHKDSDQLLGVHIIGARAGEMISEATAIMDFGGSSEDISRICHPHPTLSEAVKEAALAVDKRTLNL